MRFNTILAAVSLFLAACASTPDHDTRLVRVDHYVRVKSTAPSMRGQEAQIYVREVVRPEVQSGTSASAGVVLFVHGAGWPGEVVFDVPYKDYSWMAYLAQAGFDVFAMDMTGYGRSTRPQPMSDPCNFPKAQQAQFVPALMKATCAPSHPTPLTTIASDWDDLDAVVEYLRALRRVEKVSLVGWSQGGPRTGGYVSQQPHKVARLVVLAPFYARKMRPAAPNPLPERDGSMTARSKQDFRANWDGQIGCPEQYEPGALDAVWTAQLASDPVGAKWGPGVRRAPMGTIWGFNQTAVAKLRVMPLMTGSRSRRCCVCRRISTTRQSEGSPTKRGSGSRPAGPRPSARHRASRA